MSPQMAYIDTRPLIFLVGWLLTLLLWWTYRKVGRHQGCLLPSALAVHLVYGCLFILLATGWGPFINQKEVRTMSMNWSLQHTNLVDALHPDTAGEQPLVMLAFTSHPNHRLGLVSQELATHLLALGQERIDVTFEITRDYGKMRGFTEIEIAGLKHWDASWSYYEVSGEDHGSDPWSDPQMETNTD